MEGNKLNTSSDADKWLVSKLEEKKFVSFIIVRGIPKMVFTYGLHFFVTIIGHFHGSTGERKHTGVGQKDIQV